MRRHTERDREREESTHWLTRLKRPNDSVINLLSHSAKNRSELMIEEEESEEADYFDLLLSSCRVKWITNREMVRRRGGCDATLEKNNLNSSKIFGSNEDMAPDTLEVRC
jgi:hypothetical protein